jgi:hypothetical protein
MAAMDSRLKGYAGRVTHPTLALERAYCTICGRPYGWVSMESYAHVAQAEVIVVCDGCDERYGRMPLPELELKRTKES